MQHLCTYRPRAQRHLPMALPSLVASAGCISHRRSTLLGIRAPQPFTPSSPACFPIVLTSSSIPPVPRARCRGRHSIIDTLHDEYTDGRWLTYGDTADAQNARGSGYHDIAIRAFLPTLVSMLDIWPLRVNAADLDFDLERRGYRHHTGGSARTAVLRSPRYTLFPCPLIRWLNAIMSLQI
ncbi:hypothetical protein B0H14DRAFT_2860655 [Mycena olivaceomarginata]|nr:hypothetical protein B0H14DRAFT_2860655 [Mycena olivaceomarginata]